MNRKLLIILLVFSASNVLRLNAGEQSSGLAGEGDEMINILNRAVITGLLYIPTIGAGYWLSGKGVPYNPILFNVHKLTGLANLVLLNVTAFQVGKITPLDPAEIVFTVLTDLFFVGTIVTGGLVSLDTPMPQFVQWVHKIGPWAAVVSSGLLLYFLGWN